MKNSVNDIAVVGMSCIFPGAKDLATYWQNIVDKKPAIKVAPAHRVPALFYNKDAAVIDRHSVNMGGFIDEFLEFDPIEFGMVPNSIQGTEADQLIALKLTKTALEDAGIFEKNISLENAGIIIAKGSFGGLEMLKVNEIVVGGQNIKSLLQTICPHLSEDELEKIKKAYQQQFGNFNSQNIMGTVPNLVASLIANRFNFGGPAYTLDAACASSLLAIESGVRELQSGRCDIVVVGAMHLAQSPSMFSFFETLGALSKNQDIRPFDKNADGVLTGEGCGFVVLKKLEDAIKAKDRIYSVIKGVGVSSDGSHASVMSPSTIGQVKAVRRAWEMAGLDSSSVGYIEAHGTGTKLGDKTELDTLKEAFPHMEGTPKAGLGSVKAMIGHAMAAAGMAGFIKTVMALHKGIIPPTINCTDPLDAMLNTHFRPIEEATDWKATGLPLLAGVNAFGFGGANAHVVLEHFPEVNAQKVEDTVLLLSRASIEELITAIQYSDFTMGEGQYRIAVFNPTKDRLALAVRILEKRIDWRGKQDIWFTPNPLLNDKNNKIAFIFPGLDIPGLDWLNGTDIEQFSHYFSCSELADIALDINVNKARALETFQIMIDAELKRLGVEPDVIAGHSLGEWTACASIGLVDKQSIEKLNTLINTTEYPDLGSAFITVNCGIEKIYQYLSENDEFYVSNDNCDQQIVITVAAPNAELIRDKLTQQGIVSHLLPFSTGYHSPFAQSLVGSTQYNVDNVLVFNLPKTPIWSSISAKQYPDNIDEIKKLHVDFITHPVRFREMIENMYEAGVRCFVQIGNGATVGFVSNILNDKPHTVISSGSTKRSTSSQLMRVLAALFVEGKGSKVSCLKRLKPVEKKLNERKGLNAKIDISYPFVDYSKVFDLPTLTKISQQAVSAKSSSKDLIMASLEQNLSQINRMQEEFLRGVSVAGMQFNSKQDISRVIDFSLKAFPFLIDHCPFKKRSITDNFDSEQEPIVPFTMFIDLAIDAFMANFPQLLLTTISDIKVHQFLWVVEPQKLELKGVWINDTKIHFSIDGVFDAVVHTSVDYASAFVPIKNESLSIDPPVLAAEVYSEGYMFHGPSYQGIREIVSFSQNSLETVIGGISVKGAVLDNMGQTLGLFNHFLGRSLRSFPVAVEKIEFYQNPIDQLGEFNCRCFTTGEDEDFFYATIELTRDQKAWCQFTGWKTKKSDLDHEGWSMLNRAEGKFLSRSLTDGVFLLENKKYKQANTWFIFSQIYLNKSELKTYNNLPLAKQKDRLLGRIVAKDAIRDILLKREARVAHPASFTVLNNAVGCPQVVSIDNTQINISIAHKKGIAIAKAAIGKNIGVDIEEIKVREPGFIEMVMNAQEQTLIASDWDKNEWITRVWVAKEAYGKSLGKGLQGSPKNYVLTAIKGDDLVIENASVRTLKYKQKIIGWTL